ncbi:MAG: hypothetical protein LAO04_16935 [Acidobacteriia bacterium]|nr:hypothetical protein [Terriglobia bacterium]
MRPWAGTVLRAFAIVNVLFATFGLYFLAKTVLIVYVTGHHPDDLAYYPQAFYGRSIINLLFLLALLAGSAFLWRLQRRGLWICNIVFGGEILYFFATALFVFSSMFVRGKIALIGHSMAATDGTGDMGISAQLLTGYPIIALIVLNIAYRKLHRAKP